MQVPFSINLAQRLGMPCYLLINAVLMMMKRAGVPVETNCGSSTGVFVEHCNIMYTECGVYQRSPEAQIIGYSGRMGQQGGESDSSRV